MGGNILAVIIVGWLDIWTGHLAILVGYTGWTYDEKDIGKVFGWLDICEGYGKGCWMVGYMGSLGTWPAEALTNQTHWRPPR